MWFVVLKISNVINLIGIMKPVDEYERIQNHFYWVGLTNLIKPKKQKKFIKLLLLFLFFNYLLIVSVLLIRVSVTIFPDWSTVLMIFISFLTSTFTRWDVPAEI